MRRSLRFLLFVFVPLIVVLVLSSCGSAEPPPSIPITEACSPENDGQQATVTGYFRLDFMIFCTDSCTIHFVETPDSETYVSADVTVGAGKNHMRDLPDPFEDSDFEVTTNEGQTLGVGDRMQISGKMSVGQDVCLMYVDQINEAP